MAPSETMTPWEEAGMTFEEYDAAMTSAPHLDRRTRRLSTLRRGLRLDIDRLNEDYWELAPGYGITWCPAMSSLTPTTQTVQ